MRVFFRILLFTLLLYVVWNYRQCSYSVLKPIFSQKLKRFAVKKVKRNYGEQVDAACKELGVSAAYFKALILLECSARKPVKSRFEPHVLKRLQALKKGEIKKYSELVPKDLKRYPERDLKMLATSWGPLQIMGYHVIKQGITIDDLIGEKGVYHAILWCKTNYGYYLKKRDFKNAFHIHNTGRRHPLLWGPKTHDPMYVDKGLMYMKALEE